MADRKGYWDKEEKKGGNSTLKHLMAKNYQIEDKMRASDDGDRRRDRDRCGVKDIFENLYFLIFCVYVCLFIDGFVSGRCYFFTSNWTQKTCSAFPLLGLA